MYHRLHDYDLAPLALLLCTFALLALSHGLTSPLFEAPDEVWHYAYVRWIAEGRGLPSMLDNASGANQQVAQPPLYYGVAALLSAPFDDSDLETLFWHNPGFGYQAPGTSADNKNMLIHTAQEHWPWRGAVLAVRMTRLASLLFGALTVISAWGLGYTAFNGRKGALLTAALVAFHPQFVFISSVVSNDSAAAALCTAALWATASTLRHGLTRRRALVMGTLAGLSILTKTSALLMPPLAGLALLWQGWRERRRLASLATPALLYGGATLLVGGWWYARNWIAYGDPLGISTHTDTLWGRSEPASLLALLPEFPTLARSFWAAYGWGHILWPDWIYGLLILAGLGALGYGAWRMGRRLREKVDPQGAIYVLNALWLGGIFTALLQWMRQVEAPHGRLLFPAIGAWALLTATGLRQLEAKLQKGLLLGLVALTALAPGARILATFAPPRLFPAPTTPPPTEILYGEQIRLLNVEVTPQRVTPGEAVNVRACWSAASPIAESYTVYLHLLGPGNSRVAERYTLPGLGRYPTPLWEPGRAFCDTYALTVEPWAAAPLRYQLLIGLFKREGGAALPAATAQGAPLALPIVGTVALAATEPPAPPTHPLDARLGEHITLHGYDAPLTAAPGETITVTLHWSAAAPLALDGVTFVHLWQPGDALPLAQHDSPPRDGWYPTYVWQPGERIPDAHPLTLPATLPPGRYPLWAGLYHAADGVRLPAFGPEGRYLHDLVPLGMLEIE